MPRLIVLNGPPGCGKSTLARRYADDHPLTLDLDIDRIRDLVGGWREHAGPAGLLARAVALAGARVHAARPATRIVHSVDGDVDGTYRDLLACLATPPGC